MGNRMHLIILLNTTLNYGKLQDPQWELWEIIPIAHS